MTALDQRQDRALEVARDFEEVVRATLLHAHEGLAVSAADEAVGANVAAGEINGSRTPGSWTRASSPEDLLAAQTVDGEGYNESR